MMLTFVILAGVLTAGMAVLLLWPLLRRRDGTPRSAITAVIVALLLLIGGGGLYALFSQYDWVEAPVADTPAAKAARLAKELARSPDNLPGWMQLGELYFDLEQYPLAIRAFQRADRLAGGTNADAISALAESMLAQDFESIRGPAGRLFERILEMQPDNPKALLYSALAAMGRGDNDTARQRFQRTLAQDLPPQIRNIVEKQMQAMDAAAASGGGEAAASPGDAQVQVRIDVSPALRYETNGNSALFVAARDPTQPGPPFAAKRLPLKFPVDVTLTAADAMMPQRHIAAGQSLEVVARISIDGQPQSASGDPFGLVGYHVGKDGRLNIVIDKLAP